MVLVSRTQRKWLEAVDRVPGRVKEAPRRGAPYTYSTTVIIRCYLLMVLLPRLRSHQAVHTFLTKHALVRRLVGLKQVPARTTLMRRFKALEQPLKARIWLMGWTFMVKGIVTVHILMADGTLHQASGRSWPAKYKHQGILPPTLRGVDTTAGWGKSPYHGWVWGYRTHPVVALTPDLEPIPLLADARPVAVQDNTILAAQLPWLPPEATVILLDSSYEDADLVEAWHERDAAGILTRWLLIDPKNRHGRPAPWRQQLQIWRHLEEVDLYALRGRLMEPFFAHWKAAFELDTVPLKGPAAQVYLLLALYAYQLLIWDNLQSGRPTYAYQHLILGLDDEQEALEIQMPLP